MKERHLGLHMPRQGDEHVQELGALLASHVDLDQLLQLASSAVMPLAPPAAAVSSTRRLPPVRIAVARDDAFCFYYEDNLTLLEEAGATLVQFSPISDKKLPADVQALYFGGGYPELHAAELQKNKEMRAAVKAFCQAGGLCWAECGGLMYLSQTMGVSPGDDQPAGSPHRFEMVGVLPFDVDMSKRMVMGYCTAVPSPSLAALLHLPQKATFRCQQFHFSEITVDGEPGEKVDNQGHGCGIKGVDCPAYAVRMEKPGAAFAPEGILQDSTIASYCHVHFAAAPGLAEAIVAAARRKLSVVSLLCSGTEAVCAITGGSHRLKAVSEFCDYPPDVRNIRKATRSLVETTGRSCEEVEAQVQKLLADGVTDFHPVDTDFFGSERPGIILSQDSCPTCSADKSSVGRALNQAGLEVERNLCVKAANVTEILDGLELVGAALGEQHSARSLRRELEYRLKAVEAACATEAKPRVLGLECVCPLVASGQWLPDMRLRAGAVDALGDEPGSAPRRLEWPEIISSRPDVMLILCCGKSARDAAEETSRHLVALPGFADLPALKARPPRLYFLDHELCSRPSLRVVDGIEQLAALIHPHCFPAEFAREALHLQLEDDEEVPNAEGFAARCQRVYPAYEKTEAADHFKRCHWLLLSPSAGCPRDVFVTALGNGAQEGVLAVPSRLDKKEVWFGGSPSMNTDAQATWQRQACDAIVGEAVPTARTDFAATVWDDILFVFGGETLDSSTPLARLELLHTKTHCWTHGSTTGTLPSARSGTTMVVDEVGGRLLVFAGWDGASYLSDVHVLDLKTWHWQAVAFDGATPEARRDHVAVSWKGTGMVIHGGSSRQGDLSDTWLLHWQGALSTWRWECWPCTEAAAVTRSKHAGVMVAETLIIAGGQSNSSPTASVHMLDLKTAEWTELPSLPRAFLHRPSLVVLTNGIAIAGRHREDEDQLYMLPHHILWQSRRSKGCELRELTQDDSGYKKSKVVVWQNSEPISLQDIRDIAAGGDEKASQALSSIEKLPEDKKPQARWAMLHRMANRLGREQYLDPATGYMVFTATYLRKRPCCGNGCRHCPYGHVNVPKTPLPAIAQDW
eukprot:TRINITY_DN35686_c0_g1_i7.p1 TRINITY_DN35686_c0_g1~~TRINITY_DN35686_c0_g1_i7.p1  ORF type:complete len:1087 (-),score=152.60 TRINITY_DN35686_c0_g1_i7:56-3316(-)